MGDHQRSRTSVTWAVVIAAVGLVTSGSAATAGGPMMGAGGHPSAAPSAAGAQSTVTVDATLSAVVRDGREHTDERSGAPRSQTTAYLTLGGKRVEIDPALAGPDQSGPVRVTVAGPDVGGRSGPDLADRLARGDARIVGIRSNAAGASGRTRGDALGVHHVIAVPVYWESAEPADPLSMTKGLQFANSFWSGNTGKQITYTVDKVFPATKISYSASNIAACDVDSIETQIERVVGAVPEGMQHHVVAITPYNEACVWSGMGYIGSGPNGHPFVWINGEQPPFVYAHEFGHNMGLTHDGSLFCWNPGRTKIVTLSDDCEQTTYDDPWNIMGARAEGALSAGDRDRLATIPPSATHLTVLDETVTLAPVAASNGIRNLVFEEDGSRYEVEYRTATGWDEWTDDLTFLHSDGHRYTTPGAGVVIRKVDKPDTYVAEYDSINVHPEGVEWQQYDRHPGLDAGESFTFPDGKLTITVESASATGATIRFDRGTSGVQRWWGADRYATSATISRNGLYATTGQAFVASGKVFTDALSGAGVAGAGDSPMLLMADPIPEPIFDEVFRLQARTTIFGGPASVSEQAANGLAIWGPVRRIAGADRYETSAAISRDAFDPGVQVAYVASGVVFPDALSGAPVAGTHRAPMLLTKPDGLPAAVAAELARLRPQSVVVLGGPASISADVLAQIRTATGVSPSRVSGDDRYAVSALISRQNFDPGAKVVFVASGEIFTDALSGAPVAGSWGAPLLLVKENSVPSAIATELTRLAPRNIVILGGPASVSSAVAIALRQFTAR